MSVFGKSNRAVLGFFENEADSITESLYAFAISYHSCSMAASNYDLRDENSNLFLFVALVLVGWEFDHILKDL